MKKGQMSGSGWAIVSLFLVLTILAVLQQVSLLTVSKVSRNIVFPLDLTTTSNESVNIDMITDSKNTSTLAQNGFVTLSESVANASDGTKILVRDTDYTITLIGESGAITTTANITLSHIGHNDTDLKVTYQTNEETKFHSALDSLEDNNLDAFELGGTAQIVLGASIILVAVIGLITAFQGRG